MTLLIVLIILAVCLPYIWRLAQPYLQRWAARRAEAMIRRAMGMPPRSDSKRRTHTKDRNGSGSGEAFHSRSGADRGPIIPKEYAVDVDYTEIHSYSEESVISGNPDGGVTYATEQQVTDAEILEIKKSSNS